MKDLSNKRFWDKISRLYSKFMKNNDEVYTKVCEEIIPYLKKDMRILELACGTGQFTRRLSGEVGQWIATDFSPKMVENAKAKLSELSSTFKVEDATNLTFEHEVFDVVLIANALHVMPNPKKALEEISRVLKTGGLIIAPTFVYDENVPKFRLWMLERLGFRTYNKWTSDNLSKFVADSGFDIVLNSVKKAKPLSECLIIGSARS